MKKSDCLVVFVDPSHSAYRWVLHTLGRMGLPIMWVQDAEDALLLAKTAEVALVMAVAGSSSDRSMKRLFNEICRVSPRTRQLMLKPPRKGLASDHPLICAMRGAMYLPGQRFQESSVIAH